MFGAGFPITLAPEKATQGGNHACRLPQCRRLLRGNRFLGNVSTESFPFGFFEENRTGYVRSFTAKLYKMEDAPGDDHIQSQAGFNAVDAGQLTFFNLAAALERAMVDLNSPAAAVPGHLF